MRFFTVKALIFKRFSFVLRGWENKPEWTVADDSRKLMFRTNLRCAKPFFFFTKSSSTFASLIKDLLRWQLVVLLSKRPVCLFSKGHPRIFCHAPPVLEALLLLAEVRLDYIVLFGGWVSSVNSTDNRLMCVFETSVSFASAFFSVVLWRTPLALSFYLALSLRRALFETSFA